ncbi:MAG: TonB family protein [Spirochaetaceae bacterium]
MVSLVLHLGIVVAVSLHMPAAAPSTSHDRHLMTTLTSGETTSEPRHEATTNPDADVDADSKPEPEPETVETGKSTDPADPPDDGALTEPEPVKKPGSDSGTKDVDVAGDREDDSADAEAGRGAEPAAEGVTGEVPRAGTPPRIELPRPVAQISPDYPVHARRRGMEGVVVVRVTISPAGEPVDTTVVSPSAHRELNEAAISAVRAARFHPGTIDDSPSEMSLSIRIVFELS